MDIDRDREGLMTIEIHHQESRIFLAKTNNDIKLMGDGNFHLRIMPNFNDYNIPFLNLQRLNKNALKKNPSFQPTIVYPFSGYLPTFRHTIRMG